MPTQSPNKLPTYELLGRKLNIHFNEEVVEQEFEGVIETFYRYSTAQIDKLAPRDKIIEAVIATRYPTFGSEIAAITNGGVEAEDHEALRVQAKALADGWLSQI